MQGRDKLFLLALFVITAVALAVVLLNRQAGKYRPGVSDQLDQAVDTAQRVYQNKQRLAVDFSNGPCLTNDLLPDWVADLVHNPRQEVDNKIENQCQAYVEGRAKHFVELDLGGNVVRVK